jgi:hypothetical protein
MMMRKLIASGLLAMVAIFPLWAQNTAPIPVLAKQERAKLFQSAGGKLVKGQWTLCAEDPAGGAATLERYDDINGDGQPGAVIYQSGSYCYGHAGQGYALVSRTTAGVWSLVEGGSGIPEFLPTRGKNGWPDISVGGPGFCFPILRWNGRAYAVHRFAYEGKPCTPNR